jgi:mannose/fructose-specific phosphotransferase system component IIA
MSEGVRGIVVAHADLARALIEAVDRIVGLEDGALTPVSNEGLGPTEIRKRLAEAAGTGPAVVFTDLREGSCGMAARQVCVDGEDQVLVTGVNLPMLLDFAMNRQRPLEEVVQRVLDRGRGGIQRMPERASP